MYILVFFFRVRVLISPLPTRCCSFCLFFFFVSHLFQISGFLFFVSRGMFRNSVIYSIFFVDSSGRLADSRDGPGCVSSVGKGIGRAIYWYNV